MLDLRAETTRPLRTEDWYKSATRWTQLTLAEDDPGRFDPDFWIDVFRRTRSNATCLSAGGYVAYYPSKVPYHHVSRFIGDSDPFGALVEGARGLGMHVMARIDPHAIHDDAAQAHPEWVAVDADGDPRRHWAFPDVWVTCAYGSYNAEYMPQIVEEVTREYDIDAVFANRWQGHGVCYCESCSKGFRDTSGQDLPLRADATDPVWRAWTAWRRDVLTRMVIDWDKRVKAIRPHASFIPNMGGASLMEFDLSLIEKHCPFLVVDDQGRRGVEPIWAAGRNGKRMRATFRDRPVVLITSIGPEEEHRWKDSVTTGTEMEAWITNGAVHGMLPWFTKFNGCVPDDRWVQPVADAFALHARLEPVLGSMTPVAEIALLDPATTLRHWAHEDRAVPEAEAMGGYHALIEARLPFEMISDQALSAEALDAFRVVVIPGAACLSDDQCAVLRAYVERGGSIVALGEVATADAEGDPRDGCGLAELFGAAHVDTARGPVKNTYAALVDDHAVTAGFDGAGRIIGGTRLIGVEAAPGVEAPLKFIPDFPDLPMEEVYPREAPRDPAVLLRKVGQGRAAWFPWNLGGIFWEVLAADHQRLIENAVRWALDRPPAVSVDGPGVLDVSVRESADATAVLLFNLTNPMMMKGPLREVLPVGAQTVSAALPDGRSGARARLLVSGQDVPVTVADGRVSLTVPGISVVEAVELVWT